MCRYLFTDARRYRIKFDGQERKKKRARVVMHSKKLKSKVKIAVRSLVDTEVGLFFHIRLIEPVIENIATMTQHLPHHMYVVITYSKNIDQP